MTKEELKQEAEELIQRFEMANSMNCFMQLTPDRKQIGEMLVMIAEPREKRIAELEMTVGTLRTFSNEQATCIENLKAQIEKMKKYIKACWVEENLNDYSSYITNASDEFRDLVKELNEEIRNGR